MKKLLVLGIVLLLGVTCAAKTNYFDDLYIGGDVTVIGTVTFADLDVVGDFSVTGNTDFNGATQLSDGSTSVRNVSAGFVSLEGPATRIGPSAATYMNIAVAATTGNTTITHVNGSTDLVTWTAAGGFDFVGAIALDAVTATGLDGPVGAVTPASGAFTTVAASDTATITYAAGSTALETSLDIDMTSSTVEANNYSIDADLTQGSVIDAAYLSRGNLQGIRTDCYAIGNIDHVYATRSGATMTMAANSETNQFYGGIFAASASGAFTLTLHDGLVGFQSTVTVDSGVTDVTGGLVTAAFFNSAPIGKNVTSPTYTVYLKSGGYTDFGQAIQIESSNLTAGMRIQVIDSFTAPIGLQFSTAGTGVLTADIELQNGETLDNATDGFINAQAPITSYAQSNLLNDRHRVTVAEINAGHELLPAIAGRAYRIVSVVAVAYGGAVGTTTTVDILGTQGTSSVKLVAYAQASLTRSAVLTSGGTGAAVLADGASYAVCDANSAVTIGKTGSDVDTATGVDIVITYVIE